MSDTMVEHFVQQMKSEFEMSLVGELNYFLGLQVKQMDDSIFVSKRKYAKVIVKNFGLDNASHKRTPAATHVKLTKDEKGEDVDQSLYRSMIGSLLYLLLAGQILLLQLEFVPDIKHNQRPAILSK